MSRFFRFIVIYYLRNMALPVFFAPLQGYTDAVYRCAHASLFRGVEAYYTPFVRIEKGDFRRKDLRDISTEANEGVPVVPQLIAGEPDELRRIVERVAADGYRRVDINLGCPFPVLANRCKGAGILPFPDRVERLLRPLSEYSDIAFSVKMRLGWTDADESLRLLPLLHAAPLTQITLHARLGRQQYKGEVDREAFARFYEACALPLVYNGDLLTVDDMVAVERRFPRLAGIMVGRGLLSAPWLAEAYVCGGTPGRDIAGRSKILHDRVFAAYRNSLQGESQLLSRMTAFWEYFLPQADRKIRKHIVKSRRVDDYLAGVSSLFSSLEEKFV